MGRFSLAWELGGKENTSRDLAIAKYNQLLDASPGILAVAMRTTLNGTTPPILHRAVEITGLMADDSEIAVANAAVEKVLTETRDGRVISFEGGDSAHSEVWENRGVRRGDCEQRVIGRTTLATAVALSIIEAHAVIDETANEEVALQTLAE